MRRKRVRISRRARKIGFLGKGLSIPASERSELAHAVALRVGDQKVFTGERDRKLYRHDLPPFPPLLGRIFTKKPAAIVRPDSAQCVAEVLDVCLEERAPAVPRGMGTVGLGGAAPVRGGVVIDLSEMGEILSIDKTERQVSVEAGCVWKGLEEELGKEGLCLSGYPPSGSASTVGGWLSTGGYGIGTLAEGSIHSQVISMEVAVPSGLLVSAGPGNGRYSIGSFTGTEGQLGIITKVTISIREVPERRALYLLRLTDEADGLPVIAGLSESDRRPFWVKLVNQERSRALAVTDAVDTGGKPFVLVAVQGSSEEAAHLDTKIRDLAKQTGLEVDDGSDAEMLWQGRFASPKTETGRRSFLAGEVLIPVARLASLLGGLRRLAREPAGLAYECHLVDRGTVLLMATYTGAGTTDPGPARDVLSTGRVAALAVKAGGIPYGIGLWNSGYTRLVVGRDYKRIRTVKAEVDRMKILNPGKFFGMTTNAGVPIPGWMYGSVTRLWRTP